MKKSLLRLTALLLVLLVQAGCAAAPQNHSLAYAAPSSALFSATRNEAAALPEEKSVSLLLPSGNAELAALLQTLAKADGIVLDTNTLPGGPDYARQAGQAAREGAYDLVLLQDEAEFEAARGTAWSVNFLESGDAGRRALAGMVPASVRLEDSSKVYGLPIGYNALGYVVNLELLALLLDAENPAALKEDLSLCSWRQWRLLCLSIEQYLARPGRIQITLGATAYYTPRYRPAGAAGLRGVFALPDAEPEALMQSAFTAALSAPYENRRALLEAQNEEKAAWAYPALGALMGLLEFETMHMTRAEGVLYRGEAYANWNKLNREEAETLFCGGTALFCRADAAGARRFEAAWPHLYGKLCLIPIKLPIPAPEQAAAQGAAESEMEEGAAPESAAPEDEQEQAALPEPQANLAFAQPETDIRAAIARQNQRLWVYSSGYLCQTGGADGNEAVGQLLLCLFGTEEGLMGLKEMGLQPHPALGGGYSLLEAQVYAAVNGPGGALLPRLPSADTSARAALGGYVTENLLNKDEWAEEEIDTFLSTGMAALGLRMEYYSATE